MRGYGFYPASMCQMAGDAMKSGNPNQTINGVKASVIYADCLETQAQQAAQAAGIPAVAGGGMDVTGGGAGGGAPPTGMGLPSIGGISLPLVLGGGLLGLFLLTRKKSAAPTPAAVAGYGRHRRRQFSALGATGGSIIPFVLGAGAIWYLFFRGQQAGAAPMLMPGGPIVGGPVTGSPFISKCDCPPGTQNWLIGGCRCEPIVAPPPGT